VQSDLPYGKDLYFAGYSNRVFIIDVLREPLKNVGGEALARRIYQKKRTTAWMQEVEQRRSSCRVYTQ
jgi:hypothetical protein